MLALHVRVVVGIINEIDAVEAEVTLLEKEMNALDELTLTLEKKVDAAVAEDRKLPPK